MPALSPTVGLGKVIQRLTPLGLFLPMTNEEHYYLTELLKMNDITTGTTLKLVPEQPNVITC